MTNMTKTLEEFLAEGAPDPFLPFESFACPEAYKVRALAVLYTVNNTRDAAGLRTMHRIPLRTAYEIVRVLEALDPLAAALALE